MPQKPQRSRRTLVALRFLVPIDPFAQLGLPHRYDVDRAALHRAYLNRSAAIHPDADASVDDEAIAALNAARATLDDPEKRAIALLNVLAARSAVRFQPADERALPDGFLMDMLELREQFDADIARNDPALKARWEQWGADRRAEHQHSVRTLFLSITDPDHAPESTLRQIRRELNAWRYIERMLEHMHAPPQT